MKKVELSISVAAMVVSIAASVFSWWQVDVARTHNKISVSPLLSLDTHIEGVGRRNGIYLSNVGLGPAIITEFAVGAKNYTASGFDGDQWGKVFEAAGLDEDCFATNWPAKRQPIKAGDEIRLATMTTAEGHGHCLLEILHLMSSKELQLTIKYESVYQVPALVKDSTSRDFASIEKILRKLRESGIDTNSAFNTSATKAAPSNP